MSTREAAFIIKTIRNGNDKASIALLKNFLIVQNKTIKFPKINRPSYYWLKPDIYVAESLREGYISGATAEHSRITELLNSVDYVVEAYDHLVDMKKGGASKQVMLNANNILKKAIESLKGKQQ